MEKPKITDLYMYDSKVEKIVGSPNYENMKILCLGGLNGEFFFYIYDNVDDIINDLCNGNLFGVRLKEKDGKLYDENMTFHNLADDFDQYAELRYYGEKDIPTSSEELKEYLMQGKKCDYKGQNCYSCELKIIHGDVYVLNEYPFMVTLDEIGRKEFLYNFDGFDIKDDETIKEFVSKNNFSFPYEDWMINVTNRKVGSTIKFKSIREYDLK